MSVILLVTLIRYLYVLNGEKVLSRKCRQDDTVTIVCNHIPEDIPTGILKFRLDKETPDTLVLNTSTFMDENWRKLQYLEFTEDEHTHLVFKDGCFNRLKSLQELHIRVWYPQIFQNSFSGLDHVKTLEVNGCGNLKIEDFKLAIKGSNILPGLKKIVLSNWNFYTGTYAFDDNLVEALLPRNITNIDISKSQVSDLDVTSLERFKYLEVLNASYTTIGNFDDATLSADVAKHIQVFDLSHAVLPKEVIPFLPGKLVIHNITLVFSRVRFWDLQKMFAPKTVNISGIVPHLTSFWLYNITIQIDIDPKWYTKTIKIQQNNFKRVDVRLLCDKFYFSSVQNLDITDNGMEFLHPTFLSCLPNLRRLDLSKNQLYKMVDEDSFLFQNLFSGLRYLKLIRLSANGLQKIPSKLFKNRQSIEVADLSFNRLEQVTFNLSDLQNLKVLDLKGNNIHILDSQSINFLNSIPQGSKINSSKAKVILRLNPILCSVCEAKPFIQWLLSTSLINMDSPRLKCLDENGKNKDINVNTAEMVQKICERKTVIISFSISAAVTCLIIFSCAIIIYKRYKQKKKSRNRTNVINNLRDGEGKYKFAVFLSFSNEDEEFVHSHILEQLNENLQLMTGIDRTLVCTGDQHFRPGFNTHEETFRLLDAASVLIVVVSNNFLASNFCLSELDKAYEKRMPIVLMLKEQVDPDNMKSTLKTLYQNNTRILWNFENGEYVLKTSWENVCKSVLDLIGCQK
ncbi:uncharacterized protein LOC123565903 [Mercenaria mercenaria]|uniref:uncharacterized protein LOC123565903 n=1 Tax=Mercenaria mercenaria TaxID=6596 RepID=UPI00234EDA06|nr:uncharacterized protein LOC123565903 [Mercenaria mercenaria]